MKKKFDIGDAIIMPCGNSRTSDCEDLYGIILDFQETKFEYHNGMCEYQIFWFSIL